MKIVTDEGKRMLHGTGCQPTEFSTTSFEQRSFLWHQPKQGIIFQEETPHPS